MDQGLTREELVRICAHEVLRLFSDRLVEDEEIQWCSDKIDEVARQLLLQLITMRFSNAHCFTARGLPRTQGVLIEMS